MKKLLVLLAVLLVYTHSWAMCESVGYSTNFSSGVSCSTGGCPFAVDPSSLCENKDVCKSTRTCPPTIQNGGFISTGGYLRFSGACSVHNCTNSTANNYCYYPIRCTTQAEADSVYCALNPTAEGCQTEIDTTLFACTDNISGNGGLYRLSCKATNGVVTSCNGKTNVDIATDGTLVRPLQGTCAQNGFGTGVIGGATSDSTQPKSANADCFAIIGSKCVMKDKASGNTFTCDCDGSCDYALRSLVAGNASCTNPYEQPEENDSLTLPISSDSQNPSSSGSGEGSSPSSSPSGEGNSSDFEYDYTEFLTNIQANTQQTATELGRSNEFLNGIQNNTETANSLLQAIANKDWSPNINVSAPNVNVQGDTNIINVEVQGDTARAPAEILGFLRDSTGWAETQALVNQDRAKWGAYADSITAVASAFVASMDSAMNDTTWAKHGTDIDSAVSTTGANFRAYMDTIENSPFNDTLDGWASAITNNGVISGEGSNNCPSLLTRQVTFEFPIVGRVQGGSLGKYLCEPVEPFGLTLWTLARTLLRFIVALSCMIWIYSEVVGVRTTGEDE